MIFKNYHEMTRPLSDQRGVSALLIVIVVGATLAVFMLTLQTYISTHARMLARARLAYKYTFVMEDAARFIVNARLEYLANKAAGLGCGAGKTAQYVTTDTSSTGIRACLPDTPANRCLNGEACICNSTDYANEALCASHSASLWDPEASKNLVVVKSKEKDEGLLAAFDKGMFENLIPDFDRKYQKWFHRFILRKPSHAVQLFDEAVAMANATYTFTTAGPHPLNVGNDTGPLNLLTNSVQSPYATGGARAYTRRDCGVSRCIDIKLCVDNSKEPALGNQAQVCFVQKISRSFVFPHGNGANNVPCDTSMIDYAACIGAPPCCTIGADPEVPVAATECGHPDNVNCPWRDRF